MGKDRKICPLSHESGVNQFGVSWGGFEDCHQEKCAWWDKYKKRCAIFGIARIPEEIEATCETCYYWNQLKENDEVGNCNNKNQLITHKNGLITPRWKEACEYYKKET